MKKISKNIPFFQISVVIFAIIVYFKMQSSAETTSLIFDLVKQEIEIRKYTDSLQLEFNKEVVVSIKNRNQIK